MAYFKCPLHTDYELQFIKISNFNEIEAHSLFYCAACLGQFRNQESRNFLSIQRVIQSGSDQILQKWPILNDNSILEELGSILNSLGGEKDLIDGLNQFFDSFLISVQEKISSRKAFFMSKLEQAFKDKKQLTKKYNQISKIEVLKSILLSEPIDLSTKENQLKELISILNSEKNQNTEVLSSFVESMNFFQQIGNQHLKNAQNQIFESLDFFGNIIYANQRQESLILVDSINIQTVVKPSISFDSSLDELDKILDVSIINSNCQSNILELESLYLQNKINDLIQNSQSNFVVDSYQQQKERQKNINQIEQVGKPTFLDDQNQPNLEQQDLNVSYVSCISSLNQILQYLVKNKLIEDKNIQINSLDQKDLLKVINFASHLQHQYNQESYSRNVKNSNHVRVLNEIISEKLSNIFVENQVEDYLIETFPFLINNLDLKLLNAYKQDTCQLKYNLMPLIVFKQSTMNRKLNPLYIKKLSNGIICIKATQKKYYTQCFSDVLSTNAKLIFRFKIECSSNLKNFSIGLVYDKMVSNKALICDLDCQMLFYDNNLHVAGGAISSYRNNQNTLINCKNSLLEVRVDLKNKQLEVTDFPNYKNKFSLHEQFKKQINDKQLRLFIYLSSPSFAIELREFFAVNKY
ncbi:hypothetical protein ABPG72_012978 [Tetrahymena utriculariae]